MRPSALHHAILLACQRMQHGWGISQKNLHLPILCLEFGKNMFSSEGWVGGSAPDTDAVDVQLAPDNRTGVSKRHLRIDIHLPSCYPRVKVLPTATGFNVHKMGAWRL